jgi:hypothetical protein
MNEIIGLVTFDSDSFAMIKELNKSSDISFRILTINNFTKINTTMSQDLERLEKYEILDNVSVKEYIYKNLSGINKIYCITNYSEYNNSIAYELFKAMKEIDKNVQVLAINLKEVTLSALKIAMDNSLPLDKESHKYFMVKKIIDKLSGTIFTRILSKFMNRTIIGSNSSTNLFIKMYENRFKEKNTKIKIINLEESVETHYLNIKNMSKSDIIINMLKLYPSLEINEVIDQINKYYYGIRKDNTFIPYLCYGIPKLEKIKKIYKEYGLIFKDRTSDIEDSFMFANVFEHIPRGTANDKFLYQIIVIKTLLYFMDVPVKKEKLFYSGGQIYDYYSTIFEEDFLEFLDSTFGIEHWHIDLVLNKNLKIKNKMFFNNSYSIIDLLYDIDGYKNIFINENNLEYYIHKLNQNGLIKIINTDIIFTEKSNLLYKTLKENNILNIFTEEFRENLYNNIYSNMKKSTELYSMINEYLKDIKPLTNLLNSTTVNQIKKLKSMKNVPEEAFKNKETAMKFISDSIDDRLPTEEQIKYAKYISDNTGIKIEENILTSAKDLGKWIYDNKMKIVKEPTEDMKKLAKKLSKEFNLKLDKETLKDYVKTQEFIKKLI